MGRYHPSKHASNPEHEEIVRSRRVDDWRRSHPNERLDLKNAELCRESLQGLNLSDADMSDCCLGQSQLGGTVFRRANLSRANFERASAGRAYFTEANLTGAQFHDASLAGADFALADLSGASLIRVGFQSVVHGAPSRSAGLNLFRAKLVGTKLAGAELPRSD